uniref:Phosphate transporter n=1 Tax=Macrostomum lignano TaxID=282301 RepID=A0A1I8GD99_9PLAT
QIWIVVLGFIIAFVLAFGIGANDVANSFGTSVGSKVLTLRQACILASIFETLGSVLLGAKVSETIRKGIITPELYIKDNVNQTNGTIGDGSQLMMLGQLSSLAGTCIWLLVATFFRVPVSGTHSIVGATVGFSLVAKGTQGVDWMKLGLIVASWFISPLLSGGISVFFFYLVKRFVLTKKDPLEPGLRFLPLIYGFTIVINVFSIVYEGPDLLKFNLIPLWGAIVIAYTVGIICSVAVKQFVIPWQRRRILKEMNELEIEMQRLTNGQLDDANENDEDQDVKLAAGNGERRLGDRIPEKIAEEEDELTDSTAALDKMKVLTGAAAANDEDNPKVAVLSAAGKRKQKKSLLKLPFKRDGKNGGEEEEVPASADEAEGAEVPEMRDQPEQCRIFAWLQILTAVFGSFAHGGNDVSNAIGPLVGLWSIATTQDILSKPTMTPVHILLFGGVGISIGLWVWGRRVIKTLGEDLTTITPSSGFCIELGAALAVLIASNIGIPISTTHCKVGSVVLVGFFRSRDNVQWSIFRNILLAWVVTLPISGGISGGIMAFLRAVLYRPQAAA